MITPISITKDGDIVSISSINLKLWRIKAGRNIYSSFVKKNITLDRIRYNYLYMYIRSVFLVNKVPGMITPMVVWQCKVIFGALSWMVVVSTDCFLCDLDGYKNIIKWIMWDCEQEMYVECSLQINPINNIHGNRRLRAYFANNENYVYSISKSKYSTLVSFWVCCRCAYLKC